MDKDKKYTVYMHTNKLNNKVYVGITSTDIMRRWSNGNGYLKRNKYGEYHQAKFARAINKYGWDNFDHIIFAERLTHDEACDMDRLLIAVWKSIENGYNCTAGGEGNVGHKHSEETKRKMSESAKGDKNHNYGIRLSEEHRSKISASLQSIKSERIGANSTCAIKIAQYDLNGCLIRIWDCMSDASRNLDINLQNISKCCKGKYKTAGGFIWRYENEELTEKHFKWCNTNDKKIAVAQYTKEGMFITTYDSASEASRILGINANSINACCRHAYKSAGGYVWRYANELGIAV